MARTPSTSLLIRRDKAGAAVILAWRRLTDSGKAGRTLIACSGGADSCALALCIAAATKNAAVAHVVHDMRPREQALADRDAAKALAERCGLPFFEAEVSAKAKRDNPEAVARRRRYAALRDIAVREKFRFVAAAHHADDQAETVLMRLIRGAGPKGLGAMPAVRTLGSVKLIRPMLGITRADTEHLCKLAAWEWSEDETNRDTRRLRSAIRYGVMPVLRGIRTDAAKRMGGAAYLCRGAAKVIERAARVNLEMADRDSAVLHWERSWMRIHPPVLIGETLRRAAIKLMDGRGRDSLSFEAISPVVRACGDGKRHRRIFTIAGAIFGVDANRVWVGPRGTVARDFGLHVGLGSGLGSGRGRYAPNPANADEPRGMMKRKTGKQKGKV